MAKATTEAKGFTMADFAKKLNKEYANDNLIIKSNVVPVYQRLSSGMMGMDYPLYGGLPYGRLMVYAGLEHSGKTTAACAELAAYQRENPDKICAYVDVEHSLDLQFQALMNGIDLERLYYISPEGMSGEQILEMILELEETDDIGLIVLNSFSITFCGTSAGIESRTIRPISSVSSSSRIISRICSPDMPSGLI